MLVKYSKFNSGAKPPIIKKMPNINRCPRKNLQIVKVKPTNIVLDTIYMPFKIIGNALSALANMQLILIESLVPLHRHEIINNQHKREFNYPTDDENEIKIIQTGNRFR